MLEAENRGQGLGFQLSVVAQFWFYVPTVAFLVNPTAYDCDVVLEKQQRPGL
jgi:hypothetical protein